MLTSKQILEQKIITNLIDEKIQKQQVGIDVTVKEVYEIDLETKEEPIIDFDNKTRRVSKLKKIEYENDEIKLWQGTTYLIILNEQFNIPPNIAGIIYPRSSLHSCGITIDSAIFDPGYTGGGRLYLDATNQVIIKKNARIGQFVCYRLLEDSDNMYQGIWKDKKVM